MSRVSGVSVCAERFRFYDNSGDTGEEIIRLRKTIGGFAAGRSPLVGATGFESQKGLFASCGKVRQMRL